MEKLERLYHKHFNSIIEKIALGFILIYGASVICLSILILIGDNTILKTAVNRVAESVKFYIPIGIGFIPVIRYSEIIKRKSILEEITSKSYKDRFAEVVKLWQVLLVSSIGILIIHKLVLPIISNGSSEIFTSIIVALKNDFMLDGYIISYSILLGSTIIGSSVFRDCSKVNIFLKIIFMLVCVYMYSKVIEFIPNLFVNENEMYYKINYIYKYAIQIIINIGLTILMGRFIFNNINKVKFRDKSISGLW